MNNKSEDYLEGLTDAMDMVRLVFRTGKLPAQTGVPVVDQTLHLAHIHSKSSRAQSGETLSIASPEIAMSIIAALAMRSGGTLDISPKEIKNVLGKVIAEDTHFCNQSAVDGSKDTFGGLIPHVRLSVSELGTRDQSKLDEEDDSKHATKH